MDKRINSGSRAMCCSASFLIYKMGWYKSLFHAVAGGLNESLCEGAQCPTHCGSQMAIIWSLHSKTLKSVLTHSFKSMCVGVGRGSESPVHFVFLKSPINQCSPLSLEGGEGNFSSSSWSSVFMQAVVCVCLLLGCVPSTHTTPPTPQAPWPHCQGWFFSSCSSSDSSVKAPVCSERVWVTSWLLSHLTQDRLDSPQMLCTVYHVVPTFLYPNQYGRGLGGTTWTLH